MKKRILFSAIALLSLSAFAQKKNAHVVQVDNNGRTIQNDTELLSKQESKKIEEKDCEEYHLGKILFINQTKKDITLEILDPKGEKVLDILIKAEHSAYVNDIEVGEYHYKASNGKKVKKKNLVNVVECMLKGIILDEKTFK
jgi:hypothetical protein